MKLLDKQRWNTIVRTNAGTAAIAALLAGIAAHLFGIVTILNNYDSIIAQPASYGTGVTSGRWFLNILGDIVGKCGGNYSLATVNGLLLIVFLAISAGFLVSAIRIQNRLSAILVGMLFVVFPAATSIMFFRYTAVYYGIAILLSVLAAWILERTKYGVLLSALFTALSLGIYQAYVPLTIGIFVLILIRQTLQESVPVKDVVKNGIWQCVALILGLALYFICLKITLWIYKTSLSDYQGVGEMGQLSLTDIPGLVWRAFSTFCTFPLKDYCELANTKFLKLLYGLLAVLTAVQLGYLLIQKTVKPVNKLMTVLLCMIFPVAVNFIVIMCPNSWIYTLMVYGFALVPCVPVVMGECLPDVPAAKYGRRIASAALLILVFAYANGANVNYTALYYANRQTENYLNAMVVQVRMTEGFNTEKDWAFIGSIDDPLMYNSWQEEDVYGGNNAAVDLINKYSRNWWIRYSFGYSIPQASEEKTQQLAQMQEVKAMPCWPDEGSIKVIGDTVVIKFQNTTDAS